MKDSVFTITTYLHERTVTVHTERGKYYRGMRRNCKEHVSANDLSVDDGKEYGCFVAESKLLRYNNIKNGSKKLPKLLKPFKGVSSNKDQVFHIIVYMDNSFNITTNWNKWVDALCWYFEPEILDKTTCVFTGEKAQNIVAIGRMLKA